MAFGELGIQLLCAGALTLGRAAGFVLVSPFPGSAAPAQVRVALVLALTLALAPTVAAFAEVPAGPLALAPLVVWELGVGVVIGAVFRFMFAATEVLGGVLGNVTWLSAPVALNPALGAEDSAVASLIGLFAMLLALAAGVHRVVLQYLGASFNVIPVGSPVALGNVAFAFVDLGSRALEAGVRLALPVLLVSQLVQVALAFVARVAPQLQIFNVGFAVLVAASLLALLAALPAIAHGLAGFFGILPDTYEAVLRALPTAP
ncbi:MAG: flagellar biosynthetic protein FliR [Polyangiaceae bacterium]|nr:flagellar biosynthetic protein FliR [Polyangiaceae bacterium]